MNDDWPKNTSIYLQHAREYIPGIQSMYIIPDIYINVAYIIRVLFNDTSTDDIYKQNKERDKLSKMGVAS